MREWEKWDKEWEKSIKLSGYNLGKKDSIALRYHVEYDSDGQIRSHQDLSQTTSKNSIQKKQTRKPGKWSHWKVSKQILEESKLGRRIRREWVFHYYKFCPEGRSKLALKSMPNTLIENSLCGLKNQRNLEQPQILKSWEGGEKDVIQKGRALNSAYKLCPSLWTWAYTNGADSNTSAKGKIESWAAAQENVFTVWD